MLILEIVNKTVSHLEGEYYPNEIVVQWRVRSNIKCSLKVHSGEFSIPNRDPRRTVEHLLYLLPLISELPQGLRLPPGVLAHGYRLDSSEVRSVNLSIARTRVKLIKTLVPIKVSEAQISHSIIVLIQLIWVWYQRTVIVLVLYSVIVSICITIITESITIRVNLICIVHTGAVVAAIRNSIQVHICPVVTGVTHEVVVVVVLVRVEDLPAVVAQVPHSVPVLVCLLHIGHIGTVILLVGQPIVVNVPVAPVTVLVAVHILLETVLYPDAVVTQIPHPVPVRVRLA